MRHATQLAVREVRNQAGEVHDAPAARFPGTEKGSGAGTKSGQSAQRGGFLLRLLDALRVVCC
jgi:hypothetical protein